MFGSLVTTLTTLIPLVVGFVIAFNPVTAAIAAGAAALTYFISRFRTLQKEYEEFNNQVVGDFEPIAPFVPTTTPKKPTERTPDPNFSFNFIEPIKATNVELKKLGELTPVLEEFQEGLSSMDIVASDINQSFMSFGNVIQGVFAQALQSQEGFFKSFLEGAKQALKAMLAQIAAMLVLNALLGVTGLGALMGLKDIGGLAGIGQVLGGVGNVNANSVGEE